jgi:hypothetical protein
LEEKRRVSIGRHVYEDGSRAIGHDMGSNISEISGNLLWCPEHVTGRTYMEMIANEAVFYQCIRQFGVNGFWCHMGQVVM